MQWQVPVTLLDGSGTGPVVLCSVQWLPGRTALGRTSTCAGADDGGRCDSSSARTALRSSSVAAVPARTPELSRDLWLVAELLHSCGWQGIGTVQTCTATSVGTGRTSCAFRYSRMCGCLGYDHHSSVAGLLGRYSCCSPVDR